ncbi:hypothetical protein [Streptomyces sp. NBC_00076]
MGSHRTVFDTGALSAPRCASVLAPLSPAERDQFTGLLIRMSGTEG